MTTPLAERLYADHRPSRQIDYGSPRVIRQRPRDKQKQRARVATGTWIVGRFTLRDGHVMLEAIERHPAWTIEPHRPLTTNFHAMYRWCTRQAARQWLLRNPDPRCQPVNLETLSGREDPTDDEGPVVTETTDQTGPRTLSPRQQDPADVPGQLLLTQL